MVQTRLDTRGADQAGHSWCRSGWTLVVQIRQDTRGADQAAQQTTTRDFTCSVSEFTSSTGSIHVFSVREFTGFCRQIWCVDTCLLLVKSRVFPFVKNTCFLHVYSPDCRT